MGCIRDFVSDNWITELAYNAFLHGYKYVNYGTNK